MKPANSADQSLTNSAPASFPAKVIPPPSPATKQSPPIDVKPRMVLDITHDENMPVPVPVEIKLTRPKTPTIPAPPLPSLPAPPLPSSSNLSSSKISTSTASHVEYDFGFNDEDIDMEELARIEREAMEAAEAAAAARASGGARRSASNNGAHYSANG